IVDPEHKTKVEAAFIDSPMRFLITQVLWQRYQGSVRPPEPLKTPDTPGFPGDVQPGKTEDPGATAPEETEYIELAIYGVLTLYERPNRPQIGPPTGAPPEQK